MELASLPACALSLIYDSLDEFSQYRMTHLMSFFLHRADAKEATRSNPLDTSRGLLRLAIERSELMKLRSERLIETRDSLSGVSPNVLAEFIFANHALDVNAYSGKMVTGLITFDNLLNIVVFDQCPDNDSLPVLPLMVMTGYISRFFEIAVKGTWSARVWCQYAENAIAQLRSIISLVIRFPPVMSNAQWSKLFNSLHDLSLRLTKLPDSVNAEDSSLTFHFMQLTRKRLDKKIDVLETYHRWSKYHSF